MSPRMMSVAAALYTVAAANTPLMPRKGLHIEWRTSGSECPCWDTTGNTAAWSACLDWVSGLTGRPADKLSIIQIRYTDGGGGRKKIIVNVEDFDHTTSLDALDATVRTQAASDGTGIVANAGTFLTGTTDAYLRHNQNTCKTTGGWSWFLVTMKTTNDSPWIHGGYVRLQCWLLMGESSNTDGQCARKFDLLATRIPPRQGTSSRGTAVWEIPMQMAQGDDYKQLSCTFSRINDGNQYPRFADDWSPKTTLCSISGYGPSGGPAKTCWGENYFKGSVRFYEAGCAHSPGKYKVGPW